MNVKYLILLRLFIAIACFSLVRTESDKEDNTDGKSNISEVKKSEELSVEEKSGDEFHDLTEIRVERSSEALLDEKFASDEVKSGIDENLRKSSLDDDNQKSGETLRKEGEKSRSSFKNDTDDLDNERSVKNINEEVEEKAAVEDKLANKNDDVDDEDLVERVDDVKIATSGFVPFETQDAVLDSKVRAVQNSAEKIASSENDASFHQRSNDAAKVFGSRRSFFGDSTRPLDSSNLERTGDILNEPLLAIPEKGSLQFTKVTTQKTLPPYPLSNPPLRPLLKEYNHEKLIQKSNDPISSSESMPLEEYNLNSFSNAYPYAYKKLSPSPTSPPPGEVKKPTDLLLKFPQSLGIYPSQTKFLGANIQQVYPVTFKPAQPNLTFPPYNTYLPRYNRLPNPPFFYRQKCSLCS